MILIVFLRCRVRTTGRGVEKKVQEKICRNRWSGNEGEGER